jgi:hypothetical protein
MADWVCALDSGLCNALTTCTLCGVSILGQQPWFEIRQVGTRSLPTLLCGPCQRRDPERTQLLALLEARYGGGE